MSPFHAAALDLAARGIPVFPCEPGTKRPLTGGRSFYEATIDVEQINAWWEANPDFNPAFSPEAAGLCVVDIDGQEGEDSWAGLELAHGETPTYAVTTPRGGRHLYYRGSLPPSMSKLEAYVDTRGRGSYVLGPGSYVDERHEPGYPAGYYAAGEDKWIAEVPPWVVEGLARQRPKAKAVEGQELDTPESISRAQGYVEGLIAQGDFAVAGHGGNGKFYEVATRLGDLGISEEGCADLMQPWIDACGPQWADRDARDAIIFNAYRYRQNEVGCWAGRSAGEGYAAGVPERDYVFKAFHIEEMLSRPPKEWLVEDMIPERTVGVLYGPYGSGKTFAAVTLAMEIAVDKPVIFVAGEGGEDVAAKVEAWLERHGRPAHQLRIVERMPLANDAGLMTQFVEDMKDQGISPALIIVDTGARAMLGLDESSARDVGLFVAACDYLKFQLSTTVMVISHTGKDEARGLRGSSAYGGGMDWMVAHDTAGEGARAFRLIAKKAKGFALRQHPWCYIGEKIQQQLVYSLVTQSEYRIFTEGDDMLEPGKIGAALQRMGAVGADNSVSTSCLAFDIGGGDMASEEHIANLKKDLAKRARGPLKAYCVGAGENRKWWVPA
jgi:Bifunctional DNA primase/polymerase, N-terminal/AAA domain